MIPVGYSWQSNALRVGVELCIGVVIDEVWE